MQNIAGVQTTESHVANDELNHVREQLHKAQEELKETKTALVKANNLLAASAERPKDLRLLPKQADEKVAAAEKASRYMAKVNAAKAKEIDFFTKVLRETEGALSSEQKVRENLAGEVDQLHIIHQDAEEEIGILRLTIVAMNEELATLSKAVGYASSAAERAGQNIPDDIAMTYRKLKWDGKQTDFTSMELSKYNSCHSSAVRMVDLLTQDLFSARKKIAEDEEVLQEQGSSVNKLRQQLTDVEALIETRDNTIAELSKLQKESLDERERASSLNGDLIDKAQKQDQDYVKLSQELAELNKQLTDKDQALLAPAETIKSRDIELANLFQDMDEQTEATAEEGAALIQGNAKLSEELTKLKIDYEAKVKEFDAVRPKHGQNTGVSKDAETATTITDHSIKARELTVKKFPLVTHGGLGATSIGPDGIPVHHPSPSAETPVLKRKLGNCESKLKAFESGLKVGASLGFLACLLLLAWWLSYDVRIIYGPQEKMCTKDLGFLAPETVFGKVLVKLAKVMG